MFYLEPCYRFWKSFLRLSYELQITIMAWISIDHFFLVYLFLQRSNIKCHILIVMIISAWWRTWYLLLDTWFALFQTTELRLDSLFQTKLGFVAICPYQKLFIINLRNLFNLTLIRFLFINKVTRSQTRKLNLALFNSLYFVHCHTEFMGGTILYTNSRPHLFC